LGDFHFAIPRFRDFAISQLQFHDFDPDFAISVSISVPQLCYDFQFGFQIHFEDS